MAIAFIGAADGLIAFADSLTWGQGFTGADVTMFVTSTIIVTSGDPFDAGAAATVDSVPMTLVGFSAEPSGSFVVSTYLFKLSGLSTTVSATIVATSSLGGAVFAMVGGSAAYSGDTGGATPTVTDDDQSATTNFTMSLTTSAASGNWTIMAGKNNGDTTSAGASPTTLRLGNTQGAFIFDSGATVAASTLTSLEGVTGTSGQWNGVMAEFGSAPTSTGNPWYAYAQQ